MEIGMGDIRRGAALCMAVFLVCMAVLPLLPENLVDAWGFGLVFTSSGVPGHPYLRGTVGGESRQSWFLCLNEGASAHSNYDYSKINADVSYSDGTMEQKQLFWAYIGAFGSADGDPSMSQWIGGCTKNDAKQVAWRHYVPAWVQGMANDGFMGLENIPAGCMRPQDIYNLVGQYHAPERAMSMAQLCDRPGHISAERLYTLTGLDSWATFRRYCTLTPCNVPDGLLLSYEYDDSGISFRVTYENGILAVGTGYTPMFRVSYDPAIFRIVDITGTIEYFKCRIAGSQQLARANGHAEFSFPEFYITAGTGYSGEPGTSSTGGTGGGLSLGNEISVMVYEHTETFESNYEIELIKKDYETGMELKGSRWQVLESFPDRVLLGDHEENGGIREVNMREPPVVWEDWLIFETDLVTDENGYIHHHDVRYYDYDHKYCDGHPMPEEDDEEEEDGEEEDEDLMEEWEEAVEECESIAASSNGTFHHWISGGSERVSEAEAFESSGCRANRDRAYENFVNLRYSYTLREEDTRDGYLLHGHHGHPDDVPVEIVTTAASEAGRDCEWTACSNEDIHVAGYVRNMEFDEKEDRESAHEEKEEDGRGNNRRETIREVRREGAGQTVNFFGLSGKDPFSEECEVHLTASKQQRLPRRASGSDTEEDGYGESEGYEIAGYEEDDDSEVPLWDDLDGRVDEDVSRALESQMRYQARPGEIQAFSLETGAYALERSVESSYVRVQAPIGDSQPMAERGPNDRVAHTWVVFDTRVPGEVHFNKRDLELRQGENGNYDAYGDTQGDGTLEGAVYGLFAAEDIYGPDTQRTADGKVYKGTGVVFDTNDLVAVAATDSKGDGAFYAITERPHSIYNYQSGQIEYTGKPYPKNLYDYDGYRKVYGEEETGRIYEDFASENGDCWIGRPLIMGNYYIKELTRSEGYELSITGKDIAVTNAPDAMARDRYGTSEESYSHPVGKAWVTEKLRYAATFPEGNGAYGNRKNLLTVQVASKDAVNGYDVVFDGIPMGAEFYADQVTVRPVVAKVPIKGVWVDAQEEPLYETAKERVLKRGEDGGYIVNPDAQKTRPVAYAGVARQARLLRQGQSLGILDPERYEKDYEDTEANFRYVKYEFEQMLRQMGARTPKDPTTGLCSTVMKPVYDEAGNGGYGMPEVTIAIEGVSDNRSLIEEILNYFAASRVFTYGSLQAVELQGGTAMVTLAVGMQPDYEALYEADEDGNVVAGYLFRPNDVTGRYTLKKYGGEQVEVGNMGSNGQCRIYMTPDFIIDADGMPVDRMEYGDVFDQYLFYEAGDVLYDYCFADGSGHEKIRRKVYQAIYQEQEVEEESFDTSKVPRAESRETVKDPLGSTYVYQDSVSGQYILHVGYKDAPLAGSHVQNFTVALEDGSMEVTVRDLERIGDSNVWGYGAGDSLPVAEYLDHIQGVGAGVSCAQDFDQESSYIRSQRLICNGRHDLCEDGNTKAAPNPLSQRAVKEQVKVTKRIDTASYHNTNSYGQVHEDWFTKLFGGFKHKGEAGQAAGRMPNFRFKVYLKSNLQRLYRDASGNVVWENQDGDEMDMEFVLEAARAYPELVQKIRTQKPDKGAAPILEMLERPMEDGANMRWVESLNYDKFFDAIAVANHDRWDEGAPSYTSCHPVGNAVNRTEVTLENAKTSDAVRQFAIDWYLDAEVQSLVKKTDGGGEETEREEETAYSDELYDEAMHNAICGAEDYLKPFFAYDLDEIYAIAWDSAPDGGSDGDFTTLSADLMSSGDAGNGSSYAFGTSQYLPYGMYVVVEQQPRYADLHDFANRHYEADRPKEVELPQVFKDYAGSQASPEVMGDYYIYDADILTPDMERKYQIRFLEEAREHEKKSDRIQYRNASGSHVLYKYGLYSEVGGLADNVPFADGQQTGGHVPGICFHDQVRTMKGIRTAYDGKYAPMLVPWSVMASENQKTEITDAVNHEDGKSRYRGFAYAKFCNRFYTAKLRIEKLDDETHENLLHDSGIFAIYAASREDREDGEGKVLFYQEDTTISGTKEFLESMCAVDIRPMARRLSFTDLITGKQYGPGNLYTGIVAAGTPVCTEEEKIALGDAIGRQTAVLKSYSTVRDGQMEGDDVQTGRAYRYQTVGYLETPQPLGAGTYVICEEKAPDGYARSRPVAVEVYSDEVAYYKVLGKGSDSAGPGGQVFAAVYEYPSAEITSYANKPQDHVHTARIYIENTPITLTVEKLKESSVDTAQTTAGKTVTYKVSGRVDGKLTDIGGNPDYVYAYGNKGYLGYAWKKGTLEYLSGRKAAGENVELVFEGDTFAGYGYLTRTLKTADDKNPYVQGAVMTLFDAILLNPTGDKEDLAYEGLVVERGDSNNVTRMYVKEGYAGERIDYVREKDADGQEYVLEYQTGVDAGQEPVKTTGNVWAAITLQRHDTDILYYDLDHLDVLESFRIGGRMVYYGYDRNHQPVSLEQLGADQANYERTDTEFSVFAFRGGVPYLEFVGGNLSKLNYSPVDKVLTVDEATKVYHLDPEGSRDALVDPYTGMAYAMEEKGERGGRVFVWPVSLRRDSHGNIISRDKLSTSRLATVGEGSVPYLTGSWQSEGGEESHQKISIKRSPEGKNLNQEVLADRNNGSFAKRMRPVYDRHGLVNYYQRSGECYEKGARLYDRDGDFVRYQDADQLREYNQNAYWLLEHKELFDGDESKEDQDQRQLYHRFGEGYILENTWMTADGTPNDPFHRDMTDGQPDVLKRLPAGTYIMEELSSPEGYLKGMPTGIVVEETVQGQHISMVDKTIKIEISKVDGRTSDWSAGTLAEYSFQQVPGAEVALYEAKRVYTSDWKKYPKGYYLQKTGKEPLRYRPTGRTDNGLEMETAQWTVGEAPIYIEGIPAGDYILEELHTPQGYVTSVPVGIEVREVPEVQSWVMYDDHTKVEVRKYHQEGREKKALAGAEFTLYDGDTVIDCWETRDMGFYQGFNNAFEELYQDYGTQPQASLKWDFCGKEYSASCISVEQIRDEGDTEEESDNFPARATLVYRTSEGKDIRIAVYGEEWSLSGREYQYEYQYEYRSLNTVGEKACAYLTMDGNRRYDYLPVGKRYTLVETGVPKGFAKARDSTIIVKDTAEVQLHEVENTEGMLIVSKTLKMTKGELAGAHLAIYQAGEDGGFVRDESHCVADWYTGEDGVYSEDDFINHRIPEGYEEGDLKPHEVHRLDDGVYWLAELESPDYLNTFEPVRIEYFQGGEIRVIRTEDTLAEGELVIHKENADGEPLSGAVYELSAYLPSQLVTPVFTKVMTGKGSVVTVTGLPVGAVGQDGEVVPYVYKLMELSPPEGYRVNTEIYRWRFAPGHLGESYGFGEKAIKEITVVDQKTRIEISKKEFDVFGDKDTAGAFVEGAGLAVYEVTGRDGSGEILYEKDKPVAEWETSGTGDSHVLEGLVAGRSYILKELRAPAGYLVMEPIMFTVSADGRGIERISNEQDMVSVHMIEPASGDTEDFSMGNPVTGMVHAITVRGRYAVNVENILTNAQGTEVMRWQAPGCEQMVFGLKPGETYTLTEITHYSDGTEMVTSKETKTFYPDDKGAFRIPSRVVQQVDLSMRHVDGGVIDTFTPNPYVSERTVENHVMPENPQVTMKNRYGRDGDALDAKQAVFVDISFINTSYTESDVEILVSPEGGMKVIDYGEGSLEEGRLVFRFSRMKKLSQGNVGFVADVSGDAWSASLDVEVHCGKDVWSTRKTVPIRRENQLTVYHELTGSGKDIYGKEEETFLVQLYDAKTGDELKGNYAYRGSRSGYIRSGDKIALKGNEFITIDPKIYQNTRYCVTRSENGRMFQAWGESGHNEMREDMVSGTAYATGGGYATFTRSVPNTAKKDLFRIGETYTLMEMTRYTDGESILSGRLQFTLGESGVMSEISALNRRTKVVLSKTSITDGRELPGCEMELRDGDGELMDAWISGREPHEITGRMVPGKEYTLIEVRPADGYSYADELRFVVNDDGAIDRVTMVDLPTKVLVDKTEGGGNQPLPGALLQIWNEAGDVLESWVSSKDTYEVRAKLKAGESYVLREERAPYGYQKGDDCTFTVPKDGTPVTITYANERIKIPSGGSGKRNHPDSVKKTGTITAKYQTGFTARGVWNTDGWEDSGRIKILKKRLSDTGDARNLGWYLLMMLASLSGIIVLVAYKYCFKNKNSL